MLTSEMQKLLDLSAALSSRVAGQRAATEAVVRGRGSCARAPASPIISILFVSRADGHREDGARQGAGLLALRRRRGAHLAQLRLLRLPRPTVTAP